MSLASPTPRQAVLELVFAGSLWGFGFIATQWALVTWSPQGVLTLRFVGAVILGEILHTFFRQQKASSADRWHDFKLAIPAGLLLGASLLLQTIGLQYTTASKSGFITTLYVIIVPALNFILFKKRFSPWILAFASVACLGAYLLMNLEVSVVSAQVNEGDLWTLACAVFAAAHIIYIGQVTKKVKNPFRLNNFQSLWALMIILPMFLWNPQFQTGGITAQSLWGVLILAAACSVLAFFIQVRAQKVLSDTTASMIFLLESPYAFFFAYLLMDDTLAKTQVLGAVLIVISAVATVLLEQRGPTSKKQS